MQAKFLGLQVLDFKTNDGKEIKGSNIFVAFNDESVEIGLRTEKFFIRENISLPKDIKLNDTLKLFFNHKGKIESIEKA